MKVSVVSVTYNRPLQLLRGIKTILSQQELPDEIVIVDDGSQDEKRTEDVANKLEKICQEKGVEFQYIYIPFPEPRISCIPRNIGIRKATGDVIIFTEPEGLHVGNTIKQLIRAINHHPNNTILASQVWTMGESIYKNLIEEYFEDPYKIITHPYAMLVSGDMQNTKAPDSDWGITGESNCNAGVLFATRKEWLIDIGGFDESFEGHGWDDFDLFNRLALYGKGVKKDPDIAIIHQWHEKNYPYNIYTSAERNGKISEANIKNGIFKVNEENWGTL